jgi:hypothetical protein
MAASQRASWSCRSTARGSSAQDLTKSAPFVARFYGHADERAHDGAALRAADQDLQILVERRIVQQQTEAALAPVDLAEDRVEPRAGLEHLDDQVLLGRLGVDQLVQDPLAGAHLVEDLLEARERALDALDTAALIAVEDQAVQQPLALLDLERHLAHRSDRLGCLGSAATLVEAADGGIDVAGQLADAVERRARLADQGAEADGRDRPDLVAVAQRRSLQRADAELDV